VRYNRVYDVLNDGFRWVGVALTVIPLLFAIEFSIIEISMSSKGEGSMSVPQLISRK
jgi:hypothetical protein